MFTLFLRSDSNALRVRRLPRWAVDLKRMRAKALLMGLEPEPRRFEYVYQNPKVGSEPMR